MQPVDTSAEFALCLANIRAVRAFDDVVSLLHRAEFTYNKRRLAYNARPTVHRKELMSRAYFRYAHACYGVERIYAAQQLAERCSLGHEEITPGAIAQCQCASKLWPRAFELTEEYGALIAAAAERYSKSG